MLRAHLKFQTLYPLEPCACHDLEEVQAGGPKLHKHLSSTRPPAFHGNWASAQGADTVLMNSSSAKLMGFLSSFQCFGLARRDFLLLLRMPSMYGYPACAVQGYATKDRVQSILL